MRESIFKNNGTQINADDADFYSLMFAVILQSDRFAYGGSESCVIPPVLRALLAGGGTDWRRRLA